MTTNVAVRFLSGGYCLQNEYFVGTGRWRWRRFYATFLHGNHPIHGEFLIDTGYGPAFMKATRSLPQALLRLITYVPDDQDFVQYDYLERHRIERKKIKHIFISHFHPDHIGGLTLFPEARLIFRKASLTQLLGLSRLGQLHHVFLKELLPADIIDRSVSIEESDFYPSSEHVFPSNDFWGDSSVILLDMPGHALGHTGYLLNTLPKPLFYVTDAYWEYSAFAERRQLPWAVRKSIHSEGEYAATLEKISMLSEKLQTSPVACHCSRTEAFTRLHHAPVWGHVENPASDYISNTSPVHGD